MVTLVGIEPRTFDSESDALPLGHHTPYSFLLLCLFLVSKYDSSTNTYLSSGVPVKVKSLPPTIRTW